MTIVNKEIAEKCYEKRTKHHAQKLEKLYKPMMELMDKFADKDSSYENEKAIVYHKSTARFRFNGKWIGVCGGLDESEGGYDHIELYDWDSKEVITKIPA